MPSEKKRAIKKQLAKISLKLEYKPFIITILLTYCLILSKFTFVINIIITIIIM